MNSSITHLALSRKIKPDFRDIQSNATLQCMYTFASHARELSIPINVREYSLLEWWYMARVNILQTREMRRLTLLFTICDFLSLLRVTTGRKTRPNIYLVSEERAGKRVFYFISYLSSSFNTLRNIWATLKKCASQKINKTYHAFIRWWLTPQFWGTHGPLKVEGTVGVNVAINLPDISFHSHSFIFIHFYGSPIRNIQGGGYFQNE